MKTTDTNFANTPELTNEQYFEERKLLLASASAWDKSGGGEPAGRDRKGEA